MIEGWPTGQPVQGPAIPVLLDSRYRVLGAILGAGLAIVAMAGLYVVSAIPQIGEILLVRRFLEPDVLGPGAVPLMGWAIAPIASAVAAWRMTPRALADDRWAGSAMGVLTYAVAVAIGPLMVLVQDGSIFQPIDIGEPAALGAEAVLRSLGVIGERILTAGILSFFGFLVLLPLLVVCVGAGAVWAVAMRAVVSASGGLDEPLPRRPFEARAYLLLVGIWAVGWLGFIALAGGLFIGGSFVD